MEVLTMRKMTLAAWLQENGYRAGTSAEQILIGQMLTEETAIAVRRMVNRAYLDSINCGVLGDWVEFRWPTNVPFLRMMVDLADADTGCETNWYEALYNTMSDYDIKTIQEMENTK